MAGGTATRTLKAVFDGDADRFGKAARKAERDLKRFENGGSSATNKTSKLSRASAAAAGALGGMATKAKKGAMGLGIIAGAVIAPIAGLLAIGDEAAAMSDQIDKAKIVFATAFPEMDRWARQAANGMGLTRIEALSLAASVQDLLVPMGFTRAAAQGLTMDVVGKLAPALAEWSGGVHTTASATDVLIKAILGERDGLVALGIKVSEAQVQAELARRGQDKLTGSALEQAKAQVTLALITGKSKDALNSYSTSNDKASRKLNTVKARIRDKWQEIKIKLLPVIEKLWGMIDEHVVPAIQKFVNWLGSKQGQRAMDRFVKSVGKIIDAVVTLIGWIGDAIGWLERLFTFGDISPAMAQVRQNVRDIGGRAHGGPVESGRSYVVGERGPELFTPDVGGRITPNDELGGVGGGQFEGNLYLDSGAFLGVVRGEIRESHRGLRRAVTA